MSKRADEISRQTRIIDMMISMHSILRDRFRRRALAVDLVVLVASACLLAVRFVDPAILQVLKVTPERARLVTGIVSVIVFLMSLVMLRVDWKERSSQHARAASALAGLKSRGRTLGLTPNADYDVNAAEFLQDCARTMAGLIPIPESNFVRLKARHLQKRLLSEAIGANPGAPVFLVGLRLRIAASRHVHVSTIRGQSSDTDDSP